MSMSAAKSPAARSPKAKKTSGRSKQRGPAGDSDLESADVKLDHLLSNLGPGVIQLLVAPRGLQIPVGDPIIVDPLEPPSAIEKNAVVLAVGTAPDSSAARALIAAAGRHRAAAIAFKLLGQQCEWVPEAEQAEVALLTVADEMSWSHLYRLLALTIPSLRQSAPVAGMASVPMGDLFALANAVGALVGGAVTIEDTGARVLAYSTLSGQAIDEPRQQTILGRVVPDTPGMKAIYRRLAKSESVLRIEGIDDLPMKTLPRIAAPVRVGKETLGSIWAIEGEKALGAEAERALTEAARVAALHLIHARSSRDVERRMRGDLLRSILEGRGDVHSTLTRLGIERGSPLVVMAFELSSEDPVEEDLNRERVVDLVATYSEAYRLKGACVAISRIVYLLLPVTKNMEQDRIMAIARDMHSHAQGAIDVALNVGVSSVIGDLMHVPAACNEAERVLRVLASGRNQEHVASIDDVRSHVTLLALQDLAGDHPDLLKGPVQDIAEHDHQKKTAYVETLRAYLDAFGDIPTAAGSVGVHPNTFRYRLRRLLELFNLDIGKADQRLVIELQMRLLEGKARNSAPQLTQS